MSIAFETRTNVNEFIGKASTPRSKIKAIHWRGDVIAVVNRFVGYELVSREPAPGQEWFWTPGWQRAVEASLDSLEAGNGTLYSSPEDFLASLDE